MGSMLGRNMEIHSSRINKTVKTMMLMGAVSAAALWAQPAAPTTGDAPCTEESAVVGTDTVATGGVDAEGYFSMFDGTFKGWFQSCKTGHSENSPLGAIFRIGQSDGRPAIYTTQRGTTTGGLLMSKKKFTNYEFVFQLWMDYGNDGGFFNRTPINGRCFQTVLDYIGGASVGGTWGEGGFTGRDYRPFSYNGNEQTLTIPGSSNGELSNWTTITQKIKATTEPNLPCPATGCTQAEWRTLWDMDGWNDFKIQFYGGHAAGTGNVHMKTWFKKPTSTVWVPILQDTTLSQVVPAGYVGLQVHGGGRFGGQKGTWYRDIRWKPLDDNGKPVPQTPIPTGLHKQNPGLIESRMSANASMLTGSVNLDYTISIQDVQGRTVETFTGKAGKVSHAFKSNVYGALMVRINTVQGEKSFRLIRNPN